VHILPFKNNDSLQLVQSPAFKLHVVQETHSFKEKKKKIYFVKKKKIKLKRNKLNKKIKIKFFS
jgi:hypothetical protein